MALRAIFRAGPKSPAKLGGRADPWPASAGEGEEGTEEVELKAAALCTTVALEASIAFAEFPPGPRCSVAVPLCDRN